MAITSETQALDILKDGSRAPELRAKAARYLGRYPTTPRGMQNLVAALQDDDFGVQWEAAEALAKSSLAALPEMLRALIDPKRVGDPRVRRGIAHALHESRDPEVQALTADLVKALREPATIVAVMTAAGTLWLRWEKEKATQVQSTTGRSAD